MKKRILVTGGAGFIGSYLVDKLIDQGSEVVVVDDLSGGFKRNINPKAIFFKHDLRDRGSYKKDIFEICKDFNPHVVYHLAANAAENKAQFSPVDITSRNYDAFIRVLAAVLRIKKRAFERFIFTSSIAVYGTLQTPFKEMDKPEPEDLYGISKLAAEETLKVMSKVHNFEYVITRPHNCYDDKTEVLTSDGFKFFKDLKKEDMIATLNPETNTLVYHLAYAWQKIRLKDKLFNFKSRSYDLMITSDHKLLVKKTLRGKWVFETAESLSKSKTAYSTRLKCFADNWVGQVKNIHIIPEEKDILGRSMKNNHQNGGMKVIPMELWCQFLGWYISEGSRFKTKMNYVISISQYKSINSKNRQEIIDLVKKMGFIPYITGDKEIRIFSKQLYKELDRLNIGKSEGKNIPNEIRRLDRRFLIYLFNSLMKGDGNKSGRRYTTNSNKLVDDFCELCLKLGKSTTVSNDDNCWRISISNKNTPQLGDNYTKKVYLEKVDYDGYVYDITVPNHIIFIRRNGKACWSSNCYGPRQNMSDAFRNVVTIFMNALLKGEPYYIYGDGEQRRCFSYIDDVIYALVNCATLDVNGKIFNIGADRDYSLNELSKIIQEITGIHIKPKYLPDRPQEVKIATADHSQAKKYLHYQDKTSLAIGIKKTWEYAKKLGPQNYKNMEIEIFSPKIPKNWLKK